MGSQWALHKSHTNRQFVLLLFNLTITLTAVRCKTLNREINVNGYQQKATNNASLTTQTTTTTTIDLTNVTLATQLNLASQSPTTTETTFSLTAFPGTSERHNNSIANNMNTSQSVVQNHNLNTTSVDNSTTENAVFNMTEIKSTETYAKLDLNIINTTATANTKRSQIEIGLQNMNKLGKIENYETATDDFTYDLNRFTADYTNSPLNEEHTNNYAVEINYKTINHPSPMITINITGINEFDQIILTTPSTLYFDLKHKKYEEEQLKEPELNYHDRNNMFIGTDASTAATNFQQAIQTISEKTPQFVQLHTDDVSGNTTSEQHSMLYYNHAEVNSTKYDLSANEVNNLKNVSNANNLAKRGKYLIAPDVGEVNLTIPSSWTLANLTNIEYSKSKEGAFYNLTLTQKINTNKSPQDNETVIMKQLADWVEVMKNDVYSNHTFYNNSTNVNMITEKNNTKGSVENIQDNISAENQIAILNKSNVIGAPYETGEQRNDFNLSAIPVQENKIDIEKHSYGEIGDFDDTGFLLKNKFKNIEQYANHQNETTGPFDRISAVAKMAVDLNGIQKHTLTDVHKNVSTQNIETLSIINQITTPIGTNEVITQKSVHYTTTETTTHDGITMTDHELTTTNIPIISSFTIKSTTLTADTNTILGENDNTTAPSHQVDTTTPKFITTESTNNTKITTTDDLIENGQITDTPTMAPSTNHDQIQTEITPNTINLNPDKYKHSTTLANVIETTTVVAAIARNNNPDETTEGMITTDLLSEGIGEINPEDDTDVNAIIATSVSVVGVICLILLVTFLLLMRKRQKQITYGQRCRPVGLDAYSLDNVSVCNSVRRKGILRASIRSYGNAAFDDPTLNNNLLTMTALSRFVQNQKAIYEEFKELPTVTARADEIPPGCENKNRYANIVPLPETRVYLKRLNDDEQSEYINANFVRVPKDPTTYYIACQAPLENTIVDFWRMIWEQNSRVIIMATDLNENGIEKCVEYMPNSIVLDNRFTFGDFQVILKNREVKEKYAVSTIQLKNTITKTWREITHFWYQWPDVGVPSDASTIVAMLLEANSYLKLASPDQIDNGNGMIAEIERNVNIMDKSKSLQKIQGPLTVHCSPGTGRTGTIIACDIALRALEQTIRSVDIPQIVYCVRRGRASSVQTREQYEFVYKVAHMYATKLTGLVSEN